MSGMHILTAGTLTMPAVGGTFITNSNPSSLRAVQTNVPSCLVEEPTCLPDMPDLTAGPLTKWGVCDLEVAGAHYFIMKVTLITQLASLASTYFGA
jgi:hypothetical protein